MVEDTSKEVRATPASKTDKAVSASASVHAGSAPVVLEQDKDMKKGKGTLTLTLTGAALALGPNSASTSDAVPAAIHKVPVPVPVPAHTQGIINTKSVDVEMDSATKDTNTNSASTCTSEVQKSQTKTIVNADTAAAAIQSAAVTVIQSVSDSVAAKPKPKSKSKPIGEISGKAAAVDPEKATNSSTSTISKANTNANANANTTATPALLTKGPVVPAATATNNHNHNHNQVLPNVALAKSTLTPTPTAPLVVNANVYPLKVLNAMPTSTSAPSAAAASAVAQIQKADNLKLPASKPVSTTSVMQSKASAVKPAMAASKMVTAPTATATATATATSAAASTCTSAKEKIRPITKMTDSSKKANISTNPQLQNILIPGTTPITPTPTPTPTASQITTAPAEPTFAITSQIDNLPQNILTLLQTYGPLTPTEISYNLPSTNQSIPSILKIMTSLNVIHYQDSVGLYYFHNGDIRGDTIYPKEILDLIQDTHDEIRESMERMQLLEKELNRPVKKQRSRSAREFLKDLATKYDGKRGIRGDTVYATALRTLNVDLGLKRKIAAQETGKKKRKRNRKKVQKSGASAGGASASAGASAGVKRKSSSSSGGKGLKKIEESSVQKDKKDRMQAKDVVGGAVKDKIQIPSKVRVQSGEVVKTPTIAIANAPPVGNVPSKPAATVNTKLPSSSVSATKMPENNIVPPQQPKPKPQMTTTQTPIGTVPEPKA